MLCRYTIPWGNDLEKGAAPMAAAVAARGGGFQTRRNAKCISGVIDLELALLCFSFSNNKSLDERVDKSQRRRRTREAGRSPKSEKGHKSIKMKETCQWLTFQTRLFSPLKQSSAPKQWRNHHWNWLQTTFVIRNYLFGVSFQFSHSNVPSTYKLLRN